MLLFQARLAFGFTTGRGTAPLGSLPIVRSWIAFLLSAALLSGSAQAALTQSQFAERPAKRYFPAVSDSTADVALADFDGDGDVDALTANGFNPLRFYLNEGDGVFEDASATRLPAVRSLLRRVGLGDIDGDGDLDALFTSGRSASAAPVLLVNDGTGHFSDETAIRVPAATLLSAGRALFGDVDGDLDLDLVCPNQGGTLVNLFLNDGAGFFSDVSATQMPAVFSLKRDAALVDVDGDLDLDLVLANDSQDGLYLNDGDGFFTDATATHLPVEGSNRTNSLALVDVDLDLDLDMVVGNDSGNTLRLNNGLGIFTDASFNLPAHTEVSESVAVGDVDSDGDPDIVFGNEDQSRLYLNDGAGVFADAPFPGQGFEPDKASGLGMADLDGDGDLDLLMGRSGIEVETRPGIDRVYFNNGSGGFVNASEERVPWSRVDVSVAEFVDLDLDGDQDLLVAEGEFMRSFAATGYGEVRSYFNDGTGMFPTGQDLGLTNAVALAVGDVDGDGAPDALIGAASICFLGYGCGADRDELYLNDGSGGLVSAPMLQNFEDTFAVALADVDGDADLDALFGNWQQQNRLYRNDGNGAFTDATAGRLPSRLDNTHALETADFDADGDLDIVVGNQGQSFMYVNEGQGFFFDGTATRMPPVSRKTRALGVGDLDRDGDLDLALGNDGRAGLYLNNGAGRLLDFTDWMPQQSEETWALRLGDIDEDGDLDVVLGNRDAAGFGAVNRLLLNDGAAHFVDSGRLPNDGDRTAALALGDIDGDRDLDLVGGDLDPLNVRLLSTNRIYLNLHRQIEARLLPVLGRTYEVEVHAEPGYASGQRFAVIAFAFALLDPPVSSPPLQGTLFLQGPLMTLPLVTIPLAEGRAEVQLAVPDEASLVDLTFYTQAAILGDGKPQLTGYLVDTFRR